ncbi:hypothetical protein [Planomonospora sp. ID91781]|nr:hypothetical protein [Planomonospora sp. ID91781]
MIKRADDGADVVGTDLLTEDPPELVFTEDLALPTGPVRVDPDLG